MKIVSQIEHLQAQLNIALQVHSLAKAELRKAERKEDKADNKVRELKSQIAYAKLQSWGNNPDLSILLDSRESGVFYDATCELASHFGMGVYGKWSDTHQLNLTFGMSRSEAGAIERLAKGIRYFAPALKRIKGGWARFSVRTQQVGCAWELQYSTVRMNARLVKLVYGSAQEEIEFTTLEAALAHIEEHLWVANVIDAVIDTPAIEYAQAE